MPILVSRFLPNFLRCSINPTILFLFPLIFCRCSCKTISLVILMLGWSHIHPLSHCQNWLPQMKLNVIRSAIPMTFKVFFMSRWTNNTSVRWWLIIFFFLVSEEKKKRNGFVICHKCCYKGATLGAWIC